MFGEKLASLSLAAMDEPEATDSTQGSCFRSLLDEAMLIHAKLRAQYESMVQEMGRLRAENEKRSVRLGQRPAGHCATAVHPVYPGRPQTASKDWACATTDTAVPGVHAPAGGISMWGSDDLVSNGSGTRHPGRKRPSRGADLQDSLFPIRLPRSTSSSTADKLLPLRLPSRHGTASKESFASSKSSAGQATDGWHRGDSAIPRTPGNQSCGRLATIISATGSDVSKPVDAQSTTAPEAKEFDPAAKDSTLARLSQASKVADAAIEGRLAQHGCVRLRVLSESAERPGTPDSLSEAEPEEPGRGSVSKSTASAEDGCLSRLQAAAPPPLQAAFPPSTSFQLVAAQTTHSPRSEAMSGGRSPITMEAAALMMCDLGEGSDMVRRRDRKHLTIDSVASMGNSPEERSVVLQRLRLRLGLAGTKSVVTGQMLHNAVSAVGLTKYSVTMLIELIVVLNSGGSAHPRWKYVQRFGRRTSMLMKGTWNLFAISPGQLGAQAVCQNSLPLGESTLDPGDPRHITFHQFAKILLDPSLQVCLDADTVDMLTTIAEVLLASDANRVIAELTNTRIDDLASPPPSMDLLMALEPFVGFMIILNGALIGVQSDDAIANWIGWTWFEVCFCIFFGTEFVLRVWVSGFQRHFCGEEAGWNIFDFTILVFAVMDLFASFAGSGTLLRLIRLTRLSRVFRMFRLNMLKELTLMLKGLLGGFKTLGWAMVLLLSSIYVIALCFHMTISSDDLLPGIIDDSEIYFATVPRCMFTAFRCLTGDCTDSNGRSLAAILAKAFGVQFAVPYIICVMLITFGIFNLIIAIYIEATMSAAKVIDEGDRERRKRESIRVAHLTKSLLKKFCLAVKIANKHIGEDIAEVFAKTSSVKNTALNLQEMAMDDEDSKTDDFEKIIITKDIFLLVVQDRGVQTMMDDLDIPPERAHLFDVLDADGSGGLAVTELVQGLLKVRGEARRSDMVACLLSIRAVQDMLRELDDRYRAVAVPVTASQGQSSWAASHTS